MNGTFARRSRSLFNCLFPRSKSPQPPLLESYKLCRSSVRCRSLTKILSLLRPPPSSYPPSRQTAHAGSQNMIRTSTHPPPASSAGNLQDEALTTKSVSDAMRPILLPSWQQRFSLDVYRKASGAAIKQWPTPQRSLQECTGPNSALALVRLGLCKVVANWMNLSWAKTTLQRLQRLSSISMHATCILNPFQTWRWVAIPLPIKQPLRKASD